MAAAVAAPAAIAKVAPVSTTTETADEEHRSAPRTTAADNSTEPTPRPIPAEPQQPPLDPVDRSSSEMLQLGVRLSAAAKNKITALLTILILHVDLVLGRLDGWSWSGERTALLCPAGHPARPISAVQVRGKDVLRLRVEPAHCRGCAVRSRCTESHNPNYARSLALLLPPHPSGPAEPAEPAVRAPARDPDGPAPVADGTPRTPRPHRRSTALARWSAPRSTEPGPFQTTVPLLVPAVLRRKATDLLNDCRVTVLPGRPKSKPPLTPSWVALTPADHQHRRRTYEQHFAVRTRNPARLEVATPKRTSRAALRRALAQDFLAKSRKNFGCYK
jgi:hypothetical protein